MNFKQKMISFVSFTAIVSMLVTGCNRANPASSGQNSTVEDNQPITLTIASPYEWNDKKSVAMMQKLNEKFPNITFKVVVENKGSTLQDQVANSTPPDILYAMDAQIASIWEDLGIAEDLTPYIKKNNVDLTRYNPAWISYLRNISPSGTLLALPLYSYYDVLFYNKDIFDKFGVAYPKDGMTWPQLMDLAKQVTRSEGGTQYRGYEPRTFNIPPMEYPLLTVDPTTDKADITNDKWAKIMQYFKDIYQIPGNTPTDWSKWGSNQGESDFYNGTLAMWESGGAGGLEQAPSNLNYDMVSLPTFPDAPNQSPAISGRVFGMSTTCKYKDQAFKVIQYLTSDETEDMITKIGNVPAVLSPTIVQDFGKDDPLLQGKNKNAVIYGLTHEKAAAWPTKTSKYELQGIQALMKTVPDVVAGKIDINTALNQASDALNKSITTAKQQK